MQEAAGTSAPWKAVAVVTILILSVASVAVALTAASGTEAAILVAFGGVLLLLAAIGALMGTGILKKIALDVEVVSTGGGGEYCSDRLDWAELRGADPSCRHTLCLQAGMHATLDALADVMDAAATVTAKKAETPVDITVLPGEGQEQPAMANFKMSLAAMAPRADDITLEGALGKLKDAQAELRKVRNRYQAVPADV